MPLFNPYFATRRWLVVELTFAGVVAAALEGVREGFMKTVNLRPPFPRIRRNVMLMRLNSPPYFQRPPCIQ